MKVIIAGPRHIDEYALIGKAVWAAPFEISEIVSGMAPGVDTLAVQYAIEEGIPWKEFPALWDDLTVPGARIKIKNGRKYNAAAGPQRNTKMADYADALIAIWDMKSSGTGNMIEQARARGLKVFIYECHEEEEP